MCKSNSVKVKYIDDGTVATSINLKKCLINDPINRQRPLNYHERTMQVLPPENNLLQYYLDDTEKFTRENRMKISPKKSQVILFNKSRNWDFPPEVSFAKGNNREYVSELKLVGVVISDDLRWEEKHAIHL